LLGLDLIYKFAAQLLAGAIPENVMHGNHSP